MKEKIFINARIIDPSQSMDEKGSLILNDKGKVKAIGKNVKKTDASKDAEIIDLKDNQGVIYTGNPRILKKICPGVFGTIRPVGYCMIGKK